MIPFLPPELIRQIIESSVPHFFQSKPYVERQRTLRRLCLVSQQFREIAQPLLRQILSIRSKGNMKRLETAASENGWNNQVHQAVISTHMQGGLLRSLQDRLLRTLKDFGLVFPQITVLALTHRLKPGFDMSLLCHFSNLQTLQLEGPRFWLPEDIKLPKLLSLTILGACTSRTFLDLLSPSALPSLQVLALPSIVKPRLLYSTLQPAFLELFAQLHALFLPGSVLSTTTFEAVKPFLHKTLVDLDPRHNDLDERLLGQVEHVRILNRDDGCIHEFRKLLWQQNNIPLRSIYLHPQCTSPSGGSVYRSITSACKKRAIEVIDEAVPKDWNSEPGISEEFLRRERERRRLEANATT